MKRGIQITISIAVVFVISTFVVPNVYADLVWDGGYHEFSEGIEGEIDMINGATADITGGEIGILLCWDTSEVFVYEPSEIDLLRPSDFSTANVYGGTIGILFTLGSSNTHIYGGSLDWLDPVDLSTVNLYVESYEFDPTGGTFGDGLISGVWLYGGSFSIDLVTDEAISHINFVPEPTTLFLLTAGALMLRQQTRRNRKL